MGMTINFMCGAVLLLVCSSLLLACGDDSDFSAGTEGQPQVSASTTQVADLVANVAGERASVNGILAVNSDPHDYEPKPSDAEAMIDADLVVGSGGDLDIWLDDLIETSGSDAERLTLIDSVRTIEEGHDHGHDEHAVEGRADEDESHSDKDEEQGKKHSSEEDSGDEHGEERELAAEDEQAGETDPHWWQDPRNAVLAVDAIRNELIKIDPEGAGQYEANAAAYTAELEELDATIADCMERVPAAERKLVTSHDALGYFAAPYGIEVVGAAIPALSTQAQASAGETADLVDLIRDENVKAVFPEAGLSAALEEAIADDAGATIGGEIWADTLAPEGSDGDTYIEAMAANAGVMVDGFTGGELSCPGLTE